MLLRMQTATAAKGRRRFNLSTGGGSSREGGGRGRVGGGVGRGVGGGVKGQTGLTW